MTTQPPYQLGKTPVVDCEFTVAVDGSVRLPADHGYVVSGAISRVLPWVHSHPEVGIHPIRGRLLAHRSILLDQSSRLTFRLPANLIPDLLPLAGQNLEVDGQRLQLGTPSIRALKPVGMLYSRLVVIKGMLEPAAFLTAARAQVETHGIRAEVQLSRRRSSRPADPSGAGGQGEWVRRTLRIKNKTIVGYGVEVLDLSPEESIQLQSIGLGGRRRFGCGIFLPGSGAAH